MRGPRRRGTGVGDGRGGDHDHHDHDHDNDNDHESPDVDHDVVGTHQHVVVDHEHDNDNGRDDDHDYHDHDDGSDHDNDLERPCRGCARCTARGAARDASGHAVANTRGSSGARVYWVVVDTRCGCCPTPVGRRKCVAARACGCEGPAPRNLAALRTAEMPRPPTSLCLS